MRWLTLLISVGALIAQPNTLTPDEKQAGFVLLFDGKTLGGWTPIGTANWSVANGAIVAPEGGTGWLRNERVFSDFILKLEFKANERANSGVFLRSAEQGEPHVTGYELQIWNIHPHFQTGSLVNHLSSKKGRFKGDEWNAYEVQAKGDKWIVKLNGETVLEGSDPKAKSGHVGLQSNKDKIEFRNIKVKPI